MQIHQLKIRKKKTVKKIGRGGKRGTYSGRGMKGQKSRSGAKSDPLFEGGRSSLIERLKKIRGFKSRRPKKFNINLNNLDKKFKSGDAISVESLIKVRLVGKIEAKNGIKVLGDGKLIKKLIIGKDILLSKSAEAAIVKAGGKLPDNKKTTGKDTNNKK
ncbi:50S ribosomal protein L15 [bacterium BMS3Abin15]|nr:50S ribosomal protein L15 [bacterium BMS3Abin15]HDZ85010.1 50S ribosomal protein L15 [Candidatus Moranbacteria bacterium]